MQKINIKSHYFFLRYVCIGISECDSLGCHKAGSEMLGKKCIAIFCDAKPILYSNSYNLCSNSLFTFDTVLTDGMVTGHHHLRRIKNVYYALWADVGVLFSADSLWDNWLERVRGVI